MFTEKKLVQIQWFSSTRPIEFPTFSGLGNLICGFDHQKHHRVGECVKSYEAPYSSAAFAYLSSRSLKRIPLHSVFLEFRGTCLGST